LFIKVKHFYFKIQIQKIVSLNRYILRTFDQYVEMDYVIIYFHHGLTSNNRPSYGWLIGAYMNIDRKYDLY